MESLQRKALLLCLIESLKDKVGLGSPGEGHIQKATYLLQELLNVPLDLDFTFYKHGPYSFDLNREIAALLADGLLQAEPRPYPHRPLMNPTEKSEIVQRLVQKTIGTYRNRIEFLADKLRGRDFRELDRLATTLYIKSKALQKADKIASYLQRVKPDVSPEDAEKTLKLAELLDAEAKKLVPA